ncbi:hypothetical protein Tco_1155072 [Tanacetum coccineum]
MGDENSNQPYTLGDYSRPSHEGYRNAIELPKGAKMAIDYAAGGRHRKLRPEGAWETIKDLAQHKEEEWNDPIFSEKGIPDYIDATLEHELLRFVVHACEWTLTTTKNKGKAKHQTRNMLLRHQIPKEPYHRELEVSNTEINKSSVDQV